MAYSQEQISKSIKLAEKIASRELNTEFFDKNYKDKGGDSLNWLFSDSVNKACADVINDELAEKLLPQARIIMRIQHERENAIEKTFLGRLENAIETLDNVLDGLIHPPEQYLQGEEWANFQTSLENGDKHSIVKNVWRLLVTARIDLLLMDLPPVPPKYVIPE